MIKDRILVIDDEASIRSSLQGILEDEGYDVKTVETGEKGLDLLKRQNFGLILLDIWLPEMSGMDVLMQVKSMRSIPRSSAFSAPATGGTRVKLRRSAALVF